MGCVGGRSGLRPDGWSSSSQEPDAVYKGLVFYNMKGNLKCCFTCRQLILPELHMISCSDGGFVSRLS